MRLWNRCCLGAVIATLVMAGGCKSRPPSRETLVRQGDALVAKKQYREAAIAYFEANKDGPPDAQLLRKEADAAMGAGGLRAADRAATKAADLLPDDIGVQIFAARLKLSQRGFDEVRERMSAILIKQPDNVQVLVELGNARSHNSLPFSGLLQFSAARNKDEFDGMAFRARTGSGAVGGGRESRTRTSGPANGRFGKPLRSIPRRQIRSWRSPISSGAQVEPTRQSPY